VTFTQGPQRRFDIVGYVNGIPLVVGEAKTPVRPAVSWVDGAAQVHDDYEVNVQGSSCRTCFRSRPKEKRSASVHSGCLSRCGLPGEEVAPNSQGFRSLNGAVSSLLRPTVVLDIAQNFTVFARRQHRKIKLICRYQQYEATNQLIERVVEGKIARA